MARMITVKGMGKVSARPDYTVVTMDLNAQTMDYEKTMNLAAEQSDSVKESLSTLGFEKSDVKTTNFDVQPRFESVKDYQGNYRREFRGYECRHGLKIEFDFDMELLSKVLNAIARCDAKPVFEVRFTVKDKEAINSELLTSAVENAKKKATLLANAAGVTLGDILNIDYNWGELHLYSPTNYEFAEECCAAPMAKCLDIEPDDIDVSDTVTLVWEIK